MYLTFINAEDTRLIQSHSPAIGRGVWILNMPLISRDEITRGSVGLSEEHVVVKGKWCFFLSVYFFFIFLF